MMMGLPSASAAESSTPGSPAAMATFPGRVSRLNSTAALMRVRTEFKNAKFLNKGDRLEFWSDINPRRRCVTKVEGRSNEYLLLRVPDYDGCVRSVYLTVGSYLHFWSQDLENNLVTVKELVEVLMKKRMAMLAMKRRHENDLKTYPEKLEITTQRFDVLKRKLAAEEAKALGELEEAKTRDFVLFKQAEARLNEVESKLESYRIHDQNYTTDRWSLDPDLHFKK
jgi:hypothetical protein